MAKCYAALLTNAAYLPGLVRFLSSLRPPYRRSTPPLQLVLHDTMQRVGTKYPLVVLTTPSFPEVHLDLLATLGIKTKRIELLEPKGETLIIADRFIDTWSKLQAFALYEYERVVLIDCDMTVFRPMDELLDDESILPSNEWIACNHSCTCYPLNQDFYLPDWSVVSFPFFPFLSPFPFPFSLVHPILFPTDTFPSTPANCPYTYAQEHDGVSPSSATFNSKRTYALLNSGLVVLAPSRELYARIVDYLHNSPTVAKMALPDQDLLGEVFNGRWELEV
jgi:inositol 3-alpha-galactosyltransferase